MQGEAPGGLLAVHAHPDDETLSTGALLATWAALGRPVTVVTCTRGERGEVIPDALAGLEGDGPALAAHRAGELTAACTALGVTQQVFLDEVAREPGEAADASEASGARVLGPWADSGMAWLAPGRAGAGADVPEGAFVRVDVDRAAAALATVIRRQRPEVVAGYEPGGGYGHPDHVHAHRVMMRAVALAAEPAPEPARCPSTVPDRTPGWAVPTVLWAAVDGDALRQARAALRALGLDTPGDDEALPAAVVPAAEIDLRVDVAPVRDAVVAALGAHATQVRVLRADLDPGAGALGAFTLSDDVPQPLLAHECYRRVR